MCIKLEKVTKIYYVNFSVKALEIYMEIICILMFSSHECAQTTFRQCVFTTIFIKVFILVIV